MLRRSLMVPLCRAGYTGRRCRIDFQPSLSNLGAANTAVSVFTILHAPQSGTNSYKLSLSAALGRHCHGLPLHRVDAIGVVTGVQGMCWYEATVRGQESHTGATPMGLRRNALLGAARMIEAIHQVGMRHLPGVASVGLIENKPNSRNVVPGEVFFTVDLRHPEESTLDRMEDEYRKALSEVASDLNLKLEEKPIWKSPAVSFAPDLIDCVKYGAEKAGYSYRLMGSGAGHDACYVARVVPTTMLFSPCLAGLSHNEAESVKPEECAAATQVLLNAVLEYDRRQSR